jgi:hypothetical protein
MSKQRLVHKAGKNAFSFLPWWHGIGKNPEKINQLPGIPGHTGHQKATPMKKWIGQR